mgnify:CR=1 FL=1
MDRELILSGGAVNSPRLLLLSGIGPADELQPLGVPIVHDLPGVGKNLQDHMDVYLTAETTPVSYNSSDRPDKAALAGLQYITDQDRDRSPPRSARPECSYAARRTCHTGHPDARPAGVRDRSRPDAGRRATA